MTYDKFDVTDNLLFAQYSYTKHSLLVPVSQDGENEAGGTGTPTAIMHGEEERRGEERRGAICSWAEACRTLLVCGLCSAGSRCAPRLIKRLIFRSR
jgi:hypothetical protein